MNTCNMSEPSAASPGDSPAPSLPPVEPPSARLILRLFIVPGILVALIVGLVLMVFRSVGGGPRTPDEFISALASKNQTRKWKAAQDLAQVLPRDQDLRCDVKLALELCAMLEEELRKPPPEDEPVNQLNPFASARDKGFFEYQGELVEYLPIVLGNFTVPAALPLLEKMIDESYDKVDQGGYRYRLWNAIVAMSFLGARVEEFGALPEEKKREVLDALAAHAGAEPGKPAWAAEAREVLTLQGDAATTARHPAIVRLNQSLALATRSRDELARKYAVLALANWYGSGTEPLLRQLCHDHADIPDERFELDKDQKFSPELKEARIKEIRLNAALALARRGSPHTPWNVVAEALDEQALQAGIYKDNPGMGTTVVLKALRDLRELRKADPSLFEKQTNLVATLAALAETSPTVAIRVEAARALRGEDAQALPLPRTSREVLMIVGIGVAVVLLLTLAVVARWKRAPGPTV